MTRYQIETSGNSYYVFRFVGNDSKEYFAGYDFMGSVDWTKDPEYAMDASEACEIVKNLEAADDPDEPETDPADKKYLLKTSMDGIKESVIWTGRQLANFYDTCDIAGLFSDYDYIVVYDIEDEPKQVKLYDIVAPILEQKRWMEQEYRDYCESEGY